MRLWRHAGDMLGKYLVLRRDGTVPHWPHFVMGAMDPIVPTALAAYAREAKRQGLDREFCRDVEEEAVRFDIYRKNALEEGKKPGDPDSGPHRVDSPFVLDLMRGQSLAEAIAVHYPATFARPRDPTLKIYIASKAARRPRWRELRAAGAPFISRWIDLGDDLSDDDVDFRELWTWCMEDLQQCTTLIAVVAPGERLKGVLIEMGAALALGKRVILIGDPGRENGTWMSHPGVEWHKDGTIENTLTHLVG
jgi:hypothetical protein